jgi:hypothetical protein
MLPGDMMLMGGTSRAHRKAGLFRVPDEPDVSAAGASGLAVGDPGILGSW